MKTVWLRWRYKSWGTSWEYNLGKGLKLPNKSLAVSLKTPKKSAQSWLLISFTAYLLLKLTSYHTSVTKKQFYWLASIKQTIAFFLWLPQFRQQTLFHLEQNVHLSVSASRCWDMSFSYRKLTNNINYPILPDR